MATSLRTLGDRTQHRARMLAAIALALAVLASGCRATDPQRRSARDVEATPATTAVQPTAVSSSTPLSPQTPIPPHAVDLTDYTLLIHGLQDAIARRDKAAMGELWGDTRFPERLAVWLPGGATIGRAPRLPVVWIAGTDGTLTALVASPPLRLTGIVRDRIGTDVFGVLVEGWDGRVVDELTNPMRGRPGPVTPGTQLTPADSVVFVFRNVEPEALAANPRQDRPPHWRFLWIGDADDFIRVADLPQ